MFDDEPMEGEPSKPWKVWRVNPSDNDRQIELVAEANTREELDYRPRFDWAYRTFYKRIPVDSRADRSHAARV
jgi:hypothetical protein